MSDLLKTIQRMYERAEYDEDKCAQFASLLRDYVKNQLQDTSYMTFEELWEAKAQIEVRLALMSHTDTPYGQMIRLPDRQRKLVFGAFALTQTESPFPTTFEAQVKAFNARSVEEWTSLADVVHYVPKQQHLVQALLATLAARNEDPLLQPFFTFIQGKRIYMDDWLSLEFPLILPEACNSYAEFSTLTYSYINPEALPLILRNLDCTRDEYGQLRSNNPTQDF